MSRFLLDPDAVSAKAINIEGLAKSMDDLANKYANYNTSEASEFDFAGAVKQISRNIAGAATKMSNTQKIINNVVEKHVQLQSSLRYDPSAYDLKSNEAVALEVIQGDWGNGEERKRKLAEAGYDYATVQGLVSKVFNGTLSMASLTEMAKAASPATPSVPTSGSGSSSSQNSGTSQTAPQTSEVAGTNNNMSVKIGEANEGITDSFLPWQGTSSINGASNFGGVSYNTNGMAIIGDRYLINCPAMYGEPGDYIDIVTEDGSVVECIIGQTYVDPDANKKYGIEDGKINLSFYADEQRLNYNRNLTLPDELQANINKRIVRVENRGNYFKPEDRGE